MLHYKITVITLNSLVVTGMNFSQQTAQQMLDDNSISVESNVAYSTVTQNKNRSLREKLTVNDTRDEANIRCTNLSAVSEVDTEANVAYNIMIKRVSYHNHLQVYRRIENCSKSFNILINIPLSSSSMSL